LILKVAKAVCVNRSLQELNISYYGIPDDGAVAVSDCLKKNINLQELNMSHNSTDGAKMIAEGIRLYKSLKNLIFLIVVLLLVRQ